LHEAGVKHWIQDLTMYFILCLFIKHTIQSGQIMTKHYGCRQQQNTTEKDKTAAEPAYTIPPLIEQKRSQTFEAEKTR